jgi:hypothetical protein
MYRHVHIHHPAALRSLDKWITHLSKVRDINMWRWVRTFFTDCHQSADEITSMLAKTVNLIEVSIEMAVSSELLVTLLRHCPSLRSLEIWVDDESHEAMAHVGLFEHVKYLGITRPHCIYAPGAREPMNRLIDVPSWNMATVTSFSWDDHLLMPLHEATFMSRCQFPHLQHLDMSLWNPSAMLDGMACICRFLDAHRNIKSLGVMASPEEHMSIISFVRAPNVRIICHRCCPPRSWVPLLRPEVKMLELELTAFDCGRPDRALAVGLWELLSQFAAEVDTLPTLEQIHLRSGETNVDDALTTIEGFSSTLRSHILTLKARGIRVFVDGDEIGV